MDEKYQINWGLYNAVENFSHFGEMYFDELGQINTEVSFVPYEKGLESKDFTLKTLHTLVIHLMQRNERNCTISDLYIISDYIFNFQCRYFMMSDLKTIKSILKNNREEELWSSVYDSYDPMSHFYLLFNPRKDVVEWALKHSNELGISIDNKNHLQSMTSLLCCIILRWKFSLFLQFLFHFHKINSYQLEDNQHQNLVQFR